MALRVSSSLADHARRGPDHAGAVQKKEMALATSFQPFRLSHGIGRRRNRLRRSILQMFLLASLAGGVLPPAQGQEPLASYHVRFEGLSSQAMLQEITKLSNSAALQDRPPASLGLLRKRVDEDLSAFSQWLRAQGYFDSHVEVRIDETAEPVTVIFKVDTGPPFLLKSVELQLAGRPEMTLPDIGLAMGAPFDSAKLVQSQNRLLREFTRKGYPFAEVSERRVVVDHANHSVAVTFFVVPGPVAPFGPPRISGLVSVEESVVLNTLPWKEGDPFNVDLLEAGQKKLSALGLFSLVRVFPAQELDGGKTEISMAEQSSCLFQPPFPITCSRPKAVT